jgi:hypothetical protein
MLSSVTMRAHRVKTESLSIWTIYDKPKDYPEIFIARRFEIQAGEAVATTDIIRSPFLGTIRNHMQERGLYRIQRNENDDPCVVECWL